MPVEKQITHLIKGAEIRVIELPAEYHPDGRVPETGKLNGISVNKQILKTPGGNPIKHEQRKPLRELASELQFIETLDGNGISLYSLYSRQIDSVGNAQEIFTPDYFSKKLMNDALLAAITDAEFNEKALAKWHSMWYLVQQKSIPSEDISEILHGKAGVAFDENLLNQEQKRVIDQLSKSIHAEFLQFDLFKQTAFMASLEAYNSVLFSNLLFEKGGFSPNLLADFYLNVSGTTELRRGESDLRNHRDLFEKIKNSIDCIRRYLEFFPPQLSEIELMIQKGESRNLEFKSTLRWNIVAGIDDTKIEHAVLKTIVAYLNTDGGTLLVGVKDDGTVLGLELDHFDSDDKFLLHFTNLINERIGKNLNDLLRWELVPIQNKKVLRIHCEKSPQPVFVKNKGQDEFYIRTGPSSVQLTVRELVDYSMRRFNQ